MFSYCINKLILFIFAVTVYLFNLVLIKSNHLFNHVYQNSYWFLQAYGATEDFSQLEPQIWEVLETVQIA